MIHFGINCRPDGFVWLPDVESAHESSLAFRKVVQSSFRLFVRLGRSLFRRAPLNVSHCDVILFVEPNRANANRRRSLVNLHRSELSRGYLLQALASLTSQRHNPPRSTVRGFAGVPTTHIERVVGRCDDIQKPLMDIRDNWDVGERVIRSSPRFHWSRIS